MKLHPSDLAPEVLAAAELLMAQPMPDEQLGNGMEYAVETRRDKKFGRTIIQLSTGSHPDDGGYEGYASVTTLSFNKKGELTSARANDEFEPGGPVIQLPRDIVDRIADRFDHILERTDRKFWKDSAKRQVAHHVIFGLTRRGEDELAKKIRPSLF
jgi:hypothetical protein